MINNTKKLILYNILNGIKMEYLKTKEPFSIMESNIKITHKTIELKYLKDKNYFVKVPKDSFKKDSFKKDSFKKDSFKKPHEFTKEETAAYLERKKHRENDSNRNTTDTQRINNPDNHHTHSPNNKYKTINVDTQKGGSTYQKNIIIYY